MTRPVAIPPPRSTRKPLLIAGSTILNGIRFKRSVIEGVEISPAQGVYICQIIQFLIESRRANL